MKLVETFSANKKNWGGKGQNLDKQNKFIFLYKMLANVSQFIFILFFLHFLLIYFRVKVKVVNARLLEKAALENNYS